jgi:hypothetical protein
MKRTWNDLRKNVLRTRKDSRTSLEISQELHCGINQARALLRDAILSGRVEMVMEPRHNALDGVVRLVPCYRWVK